MRHFTKITAAVAASFTLTSGAAMAQDAASPCDQAYSMTDVNDDGYISKIEMTDYVEKQTSAMDADQSGSVSRDEYINCSLVNATPGQASRTEEDMTAMDADGDGMITQEEFMQAGAGTHAAAIAGDRVAADRAGRLIFFVEGETVPEMQTMTLNEFAARTALMFMSLDQNLDQAIDRAEFIAEAPTTTFKDIRNAEFDQADTDQSGDLTQIELIQRNQQRANRAMEQAETDTGEKSDPERGAPVFYYHYPYLI